MQPRQRSKCVRDRRVQRDRSVEARVHQVDAPARRVHLLAARARTSGTSEGRTRSGRSRRCTRGSRREHSARVELPLRCARQSCPSVRRLVTLCHLALPCVYATPAAGRTTASGRSARSRRARLERSALGLGPRPAAFARLLPDRGVGLRAADEDLRAARAVRPQHAPSPRTARPRGPGWRTSSALGWSCEPRGARDDARRPRPSRRRAFASPSAADGGGSWHGR